MSTQNIFKEQSTPGNLHPGYVIREGPPSVEAYLNLRLKAGLTTRTKEQALAALPGAWYACHIVHEETETAVGMGRVIGDGGWYFQVTDMAVLPDHQRKGLGNVILSKLMEKIKKETPPGAYVNLVADPPGRALYGKHGFVDIAPPEVAMGVFLH